MTKEDMFVFIGCILGAFIVYKIFLMFWQGSTVEGLQNRQVPNDGLLANSVTSLATATTMLETTTNELLLSNPTYNTNYSTKCTTMYDIINLQMVKIVAGLDPGLDKAAYLRALSDLNTMYQAKIALNDTLKTIDSVETTDSSTSSVMAQATAYQTQAATAAANAKNSLMASVDSIKSSF
jgi:hypothetical protein